MPKNFVVFFLSAVQCVCFKFKVFIYLCIRLCVLIFFYFVEENFLYKKLYKIYNLPIITQNSNILYNNNVPIRLKSHVFCVLSMTLRD